MLVLASSAMLVLDRKASQIQAALAGFHQAGFHHLHFAGQHAGACSVFCDALAGWPACRVKKGTRRRALGESCLRPMILKATRRFTFKASLCDSCLRPMILKAAGQTHFGHDVPYQNIPCGRSTQHSWVLAGCWLGAGGFCSIAGCWRLLAASAAMARGTLGRLLSASLPGVCWCWHRLLGHRFALPGVCCRCLVCALREPRRCARHGKPGFRRSALRVVIYTLGFRQLEALVSRSFRSHPAARTLRWLGSGLDSAMAWERLGLTFYKRPAAWL